MYSKNGDVAAGTAWVSDAGSIWENDGYLYVRSPGLVVTNGGRVESVSVRVASGDDRSQLSVFDGGIVQSSTYGQIGYGYTAQSNTGLVSGAGSLWTNGTSLAVGDYGQSNLLMIVNGGLVVSQSGTIGTSDSKAIGNRVEISGDGSPWRTLEGLTINNRGQDNVLLMRDGGVAAVGGNVTVKTGGYVTNYVTGLSGGLDLSASSSLTVDGRITIRFDAPPVSDTMHYWGLRWAGNHADALTNLLNSSSITVEDGPALPVRWHGQASVYFSEPYTYIGFDPASVLFPGTLLLVR
jgi:T5SS/PEP-CTERM-associated repeat protein